MKRNVESIIREMEESGIMMEPVMTATERMNGLLAYQDLVLKEVFNEDHAANLRLSDVVTHFKTLAGEKNLEASPAIVSAIQDMDSISREISIAVSGANGEAQVAKAIRYAHRPVRVLSNVTLSDGESMTELDQVVVTSSGILIIEAKNCKADVTISEAGQIYGPNKKPISHKVLGEQMNLKRYLLRNKLESALKNTAQNIPLHIESRVVFSNPYISVTDNYKQELYCYRTNLPHEIDNLSSQVRYSQEEMQMIENAIINVTEETPTYDVGLDFDRIRRTFAEALALLEDDSESHEASPCEAVSDSDEAKPLVFEFTLLKPKMGKAVATVVAGVAGGIAAACGLTGAMMFLNKKAM